MSALFAAAWAASKLLYGFGLRHERQCPGQKLVAKAPLTPSSAEIHALTVSKRYPSSMFAKRDATGYVPALSGIDRKTLVHGDKTLMTEFVLRKGAVLPRHSHQLEQTGYLVRGRIRLSVGLDEYDAEAGDSRCIPGGVEHGATALEDAVAIEVFSPVRQDYLPGAV